jgi:hypothetical protein
MEQQGALRVSLLSKLILILLATSAIFLAWSPAAGQTNCTISSGAPTHVLPAVLNPRVSEKSSILFYSFTFGAGDLVTQLCASRGNVRLIQATPGDQVRQLEWTYTAGDGPLDSGYVSIDVYSPGRFRKIQFFLTIVNEPPTATFSVRPNTGVSEGVSYHLSLTNVADPGGDGDAPFKYSFDCAGDGIFEVSDSDTSFYECIYPQAGDYPAVGRVKDKDGGATSYTFSVSGPVEPTLVCRNGEQPIPIVMQPEVLVLGGLAVERSFTLSSNAVNGSLVVASMVGHPEVGCPISGHPSCGQNQDNEEFYILLDDLPRVQVDDHGEDRWSNPLLYFPANLSAGEHRIVFQHTQREGNSVGSVSFKAAYCPGNGGGVVNSSSPETVTSAAPPLPPCNLAAPDSVFRVRVPVDAVYQGSIFCRVLNENGVFLSDPVTLGDLSLLDQTVMQAVDLFGLSHGGSPISSFQQPIEVCLLGSGTLVYLDATTSPRVPVPLPTFAQDGYSCASISHAGMVVLLTDSASTAAELSLSACSVTTTHMVRLRAEPNENSEIITTLPYNTSWSARGIQGNWYHVIYENRQGWVRGDYLIVDGNCQ